MSYINAIQDGSKIKVWERNISANRELVYYDTPLYFYAEDPKGKHTSLFGDKCSLLEFDNSSEYLTVRKQLESSKLKLFESDIPAVYKVLSKHYYNKPAPKLNVTYYDIEVDYDKTKGHASVSNPYAPISAISIYNDWTNHTMVLAVPPPTWGDKSNWDNLLDHSIKDVADIKFFENERYLLLYFIETIHNSDVLCGWNNEFFDTPYVAKRVELVLGPKYFKKLSFDGAPPPSYRDVEVFGNIQQTIDLGGRINADYLALFKKFEAAERPSYKLESISNEILPELPKLEYEGTLADLYRKDFNHFLRYNVRDTECLRGFEKKLGYVSLANTFYHLSTGLFSNVAGTIKLAELALINFCHEQLNVVAPNAPKISHGENGEDDKAQGAFVLKPKAGYQRMIAAIDVKSLYPHCICSINISPETLVGQFNGMVQDFEEISHNSDAPLTFLKEDGTREIKSASTWKQILKDNNWAVSGYGTVFSQEKQGIIPSILAEWYSQRNKYKKLCSKAKEDKDELMADYYDKLQYCYKIKLNSLYGALLNKHFRFYDPRMGESTTGTGRAILRHICGFVNETLTGVNDINGEAIIYGDTDSCAPSTIIDINGVKKPIEQHFNELSVNYPIHKQNEKEYLICNGDINTPCVESESEYETWSYKPVKFIYRHKTQKRMFKITTSSGNSISVTEDHSMTVINKGKLYSRTPLELQIGDDVVEQHDNILINIKIEKIELIEELGVIDDWVYDITMEDDSTPYFFGNDILIHNSCYFNTFADNVKDAVVVADAVAAKVNKSFPTFMANTFCCTKDYTNFIEVEREIVAAAGIFVKPKMYMLWVCDLGGKSCDKLKVMGLATKKTTLPKVLQDKLNKILENYIKTEDWETLATKVVELKQDLENTKDVTILGLPKGVAQVEFYTNLLNTNDSATIPGHVRASILYNEKLKEYNDTESFPITSNMKIRVYYLKNPKDKFKSIALPTDLDMIPDWFSNFDIDRNAQITRLVDKPLTNILEAIGKVPPSKQTVLVDTLLEF